MRHSAASREQPAPWPIEHTRAPKDTPLPSSGGAPCSILPPHCAGAFSNLEEVCLPLEHRWCTGGARRCASHQKEKYVKSVKSTLAALAAAGLLAFQPAAASAQPVSESEVNTTHALLFGFLPAIATMIITMVVLGGDDDGAPASP